MRLFVAVEFDAPVRAALGRMRESIAVEGRGIRWVRDELLHLTLRFLGDVEDSRIPDVTEAIRTATSGQSPLLLRLRGLGSFPGGSRPPRVLWAGVEDCPALGRLARRLEDAFRAEGFRPERRGFAAHVTLARVRGRVRLLDDLDASEPLFGEQEVEAITLMESVLGPGGPEYTPLARFPLGEEAP